MKRIVFVLLIIVAVVAVALIYLNLSKPAPRAAELLPDTTLLFLEIPNFSKTRANFQHTALHALWQEPEVQAFLEEPRRALAGVLGNSPTLLGNGNIHHLILDALQGEVFLAVTRITAIPSLQAGLIFGVDVKGKRVEAQAALSYYEHNLAKQHPEMKFEDKPPYLGVSYTVCELQPKQHLCHAFLNTLVVFTLGEDEMRDLIQRFTGQIPMDVPSLANSKKYLDVLAHLPTQHECIAYFNIEQVTSIVGPLLALAPQAGNTFQRLARIKAYASSVAFDDDKVQDVGFTTYSSAGPVPPTNQRRTLALTTAQTALYATIEVPDLPASYQEIMDSIAQSGNPSLISQAGQFEQTMTSHGVRVRDDLLAFLGPETTVIVTWHEGAPYPEVGLVTEIKNAAQLRSRLDTALDAWREAALGTNEPSAWEQEQYLGETLHTLRPAFRGTTPTYVATDSFLIFSLTPNGARQLVRQLKEPTPTLASNADYQNATKQLPANANSYIYCNMSAVFRPLYARLKVAASETGTNAFVDLRILPPADAIARHLGPFASATVTEDRAETTTAYSSLGKPLTLLVAAAGGIVVAQPYLAEYLPFIKQEATTVSSNTAVRSHRRENQKAPSQTPATP